MPKANRPLMEQITQSPLLISASGEALFQASIQHVLASEHAAKMLDQAVSASNDDDDFWPTSTDDWRASFRPYNVKDGVLQIPVMGVLLNRFPYQFGRWATGYAYIEKALQRGLDDANVKAFAFVIDSPGGEVAGCFELVDKIYEARGAKPMRSFAADHSYSAAYAIGSAPGELSVTRSGGVGSIGVVTAHVEYSKYMEDVGVKITFIYAGDHKVDGNPYEKLPEAVKSRIQERINRIYGVFTSTVARNRDMDEADVRATQALTYDANESLEVGLADRIGALDEEMVIFANEVAELENEQMADKTTTAASPENTVDKATHDAAVTSARAEGFTAAMTRAKAILASDAGKARPLAALTMALNTKLSALDSDGVIEMLNELPEEKAEAPKATAPESKTKAEKNPFDAAMEKDNPEVGADTGGNKTGDSDSDVASAILADYAGQTGRKQKTA